MALFGLFGKKDDAAEIKRLVAKATAKFGPKENRQAALERLNAIGTAESVTGLLSRFNVRVDPSIVDDEEKQYVCDALIDSGEKAVEPLKQFVLRSDHPTWALRALMQIVPAADVVTTILQSLEREGPEYTRDPEKKITLIRSLETLDDPRIAPGLVPFLADVSEDVRFSAVAAVAQRADESTRLPLIESLLSATQEHSERMRRAVSEALAKTGFSVAERARDVAAALAPGFKLDKQNKVVAG